MTIHNPWPLILAGLAAFWSAVTGVIKWLL